MKQESFKHQYLASCTWAAFFLIFNCKILFDRLCVGGQIVVAIGMFLPWTYIIYQYYKVRDSKRFKLCVVAAILMVIAIVIKFL